MRKQIPAKPATQSDHRPGDTYSKIAGKFPHRQAPEEVSGSSYPYPVKSFGRRGVRSL